MRWDNLRLDVRQSDDRLTAPLFEQGAVVRTFDTPEFKGMTFYEVHARSIINRVPEASRVPFRWTINPYRGCSHMCRYCLQGDTPILMADGRTRPISDLRVDDEVYGTVFDGKYRRYVTTTVEAHWETMKLAYRILLEDSTELIASGDHRFLTERGWKHVTDAERGPQRPHLTTNNKLIGTGAFAEPPKDDADYRRGYLCGMIRGDGTIGSRRYRRPNGSPWTQHQFRLALTDLEPLHRTRNYLDGFGVATQEFTFDGGSRSRRPLTAIRTQSKANVDSVRDLITWPAHPLLGWQKGFLAGIFDSEGSYSRGILRISNTDPSIIDHTSSALRRIGVPFTVEDPRRDNGMQVVRVLGGLRMAQRFFHTVDPATTRKLRIGGRAIKSDAPLRVRSIEPMGIELPMFDITTATGDFIANGVISHNCFARKTHTYLDMDYGEDFNSRVVVKVNAPTLLRKELSAARWKGEHIAMGTNVDPYQRAEGRYRLMRGIIEALRDFGNPFSILTKGKLILRDLDLLQEAAGVTEVGTNFSVGFVDDRVWREVETGTPRPAARLDAVRTLNEAGIPCGVLMAPVLPFLTDSDEQLEATVKAIAESNATHLSPIVLHLRKGGAREWWMAWLSRERPDLVPRYRELYGNGAYADKGYQEEVTGKIRDLARKHVVGRRTPQAARNPRRIPEPTPEPEQLRLT